MAEELNKGTDRNQDDTAIEQETEEQTNLPKSQEELNEIIAARVARERRAWAQKARSKAKSSEQPQEKPDEEHTDSGLLEAQRQLEETRRDLISTKAQIEAMRSGIRAEMVDDAVTLALREIERNGDEVDELSLKDALKTIKKRHPDDTNPDKQKALPNGKVIF